MSAGSRCQALASLADDLAKTDPRATLTHLVAELDERAAAQHAPTVEGVTLASLHAAKGLEWDAVFLVGLSEGLMPISLADGRDAVEEERRLLYVGITRAREHLHLSWSRSRTPGGRASRGPSRFLDGLLGDGASSGTGRPGTTRNRTSGPAGTGDAGRRRPSLPSRCRTCGAILTTAVERKVGRCSSCPPTYDEEVLARLRDWRAEVAAEAKVPPFVVLTDATLVAVAEARPRDEAALARIPGMGRVKTDRFGSDVLDILTGTP